MAQAPRAANGDDFVRHIVHDPKNVPDVTLLYGYPGASSEEGHERLYLSPDLSAYVEVPNDFDPASGGIAQRPGSARRLHALGEEGRRAQVQDVAGPGGGAGRNGLVFRRRAPGRRRTGRASSPGGPTAGAADPGQRLLSADHADRAVPGHGQFPVPDASCHVRRDLRCHLRATRDLRRHLRRYLRRNLPAPRELRRDLRGDLRGDLRRHMSAACDLRRHLRRDLPLHVRAGLHARDALPADAERAPVPLPHGSLHPRRRPVHACRELSAPATGGGRGGSGGSGRAVRRAHDPPERSGRLLDRLLVCLSDAPRNLRLHLRSRVLGDA